MKILILTHTFPLNPNDSTAHFMLDFANGFVELGHQVYVVLPYHPKLETDSFSKLKLVPVKYIWPEKFHLLGYSNTLINDQKLKWYVYLLFPFYFAAIFLTVWKITVSEKIDLINAHWVIPNGVIAALVTKITKIPLIISIPGSDAYLATKNSFFWNASKFALKSAKVVVSNSSQLLKDLKTEGEVISYPVPLNNGKRLSSKNLVVATAGRRVEKKGFEILEKIHPGIEIISGLTIKQLRNKLLSVDIFIALSIRDKKGNLDDASVVVLEAMAAGCSVIASELPGYRGIIQNRKNGFLVDPGSESDIKKIISQLTKSKALRTKLAQEARLTINHKYTPEKVAKVYLDLL